jgi:hypothetical protein
MSRREAITDSLAAWRNAERELAESVDGERVRIQSDIERFRDEYQRLSSESMVENMDRLKEADHRRSIATPSTPPFHEAVRDTAEIAADIWEEARRGDLDTPQRG